MSRKRRYSMNDLPSIPDEVPKKLRRTGSDTKISPNNEPDYIEINHYEGKLKKFSTSYYVTEFVLKNAISYPEERLKQVFDKLIDSAYRKANAIGKQVYIYYKLFLLFLG